MLTIRRYQASDHDAVWELHNLALEQVGAHAGNGAWDADLQQIERVYLDNGGEFLVGMYAGRIVAMGALRRTAERRAKITRMRVHPDYQRRGFGHSILTALEAHASASGYTTLHLDTTVLQSAAQQLYRKHGFRETGRTILAGFDCILYEKSLE